MLVVLRTILCTNDVFLFGFQVANSEVEKESEKIADEFLEGDASEPNVDAFLETFMVLF